MPHAGDRTGLFFFMVFDERLYSDSEKSSFFFETLSETTHPSETLGERHGSPYASGWILTFHPRVFGFFSVAADPSRTRRDGRTGRKHAREIGGGYAQSSI